MNRKQRIELTEQAFSDPKLDRTYIPVILNDLLKEHINGDDKLSNELQNKVHELILRAHSENLYTEEKEKTLLETLTILSYLGLDVSKILEKEKNTTFYLLFGETEQEMTEKEVSLFLYCVNDYKNVKSNENELTISMRKKVSQLYKSFAKRDDFVEHLHVELESRIGELDQAKKEDKSIALPLIRLMQFIKLIVLYSESKKDKAILMLNDVMTEKVSDVDSFVPYFDFAYAYPELVFASENKSIVDLGKQFYFMKPLFEEFYEKEVDKQKLRDSISKDIVDLYKCMFDDCVLMNLDKKFETKEDYKNELRKEKKAILNV